MAARNPFARSSAPGFRVAIVAVFFRVTHDGLSERGSTRSLWDKSLRPVPPCKLFRGLVAVTSALVCADLERVAQISNKC